MGAGYIFDPKPMGLLEKAFVPDFSQRCSYSASSNTLYINLSNANINSFDALEKVFSNLHNKCEKITADQEEKKMHFIVNYNRFKIDPEFVEEYQAQVQKLNAKWAL